MYFIRWNIFKIICLFILNARVCVCLKLSENSLINYMCVSAKLVSRRSENYFLRTVEERKSNTVSCVNKDFKYERNPSSADFEGNVLKVSVYQNSRNSFAVEKRKTGKVARKNVWRIHEVDRKTYDRKREKIHIHHNQRLYSVCNLEAGWNEDQHSMNNFAGSAKVGVIWMQIIRGLNLNLKPATGPSPRQFRTVHLPLCLFYFFFLCLYHSRYCEDFSRPKNHQDVRMWESSFSSTERGGGCSAVSNYTFPVHSLDERESKALYTTKRTLPCSPFSVPCLGGGGGRVRFVANCLRPPLKYLPKCKG